MKKLGWLFAGILVIILGACQVATPTTAPYPAPQPPFSVSATLPRVGARGVTPLPSLQVGDAISITSGSGLFLNGTPLAGANTPIAIAAATATPSPTATATSTNTPTATATATQTFTPSPSATATGTATSTPTASPSPTNTQTPSATATRTNTPTATATATPSGVNLAQNPGFETGLTPWTSYGNASVVTSNAHSGTRAVQLTYAAPWGSGVEQVITGLLPNTTYALSAWARLDTGATDAIVPGVKEYDSAGNQVSVLVTSTAYTQVAMQFTTGASSTSARIYCWRGSGSGNAYCDDFAVIAAGASPTVTPTSVPPTPTPGALATPYQLYLVWISAAGGPPTSLNDFEQQPILAVQTYGDDGQPLNGVVVLFEMCDAPGAFACTQYDTATAVTTHAETMNSQTQSGVAKVVVAPDYWYRASISRTVIFHEYWVTGTLFSGVPVRVLQSGVTTLGTAPQAANNIARNFTLVVIIIIVISVVVWWLRSKSQ